MKKKLNIPPTFSIIDCKDGIMLVAQPFNRNTITITPEMMTFMTERGYIQAFVTEEEFIPDAGVDRVFIRWASPAEIADKWEQHTAKG